MSANHQGPVSFANSGSGSASQPSSPPSSSSPLIRSPDRKRRKSGGGGGSGSAGAGSKSQQKKPLAEISTVGAIPEAVLDELCARFIINVPEEEFESPERLMFMIEEAHWFYIDFCRKQDKQRQLLPSMNLKSFAAQLLEHWLPLGHHLPQLETIINLWQSYKSSISSFGAILVNQRRDQVLLIKPFQGRRYSFPKGKIYRGETDVQCAIREVFEEVGFDATDRLTEQSAFIEYKQGEQLVKLFVVLDVDSERTSFRTQTRMEVSSIEWHSISSILQGTQDVYGNTIGLVRRMQDEVLGSASVSSSVAAPTTQQRLPKQQAVRNVKDKQTREKRTRDQTVAAVAKDKVKPVVNAQANFDAVANIPLVQASQNSPGSDDENKRTKRKRRSGGSGGNGSNSPPSFKSSSKQQQAPVAPVQQQQQQPSPVAAFAILKRPPSAVAVAVQ